MKICNKQKGMSLIELIIAMAIASIGMTMIYTTYFSQIRSHNTQSKVTELVQSLRGAMDIMTAEIRMAGYDPTGDANAGIVKATKSELIFTQDLWYDISNPDGNNSCDSASDEDCDDDIRRGDGDTDDSNEVIRYALQEDSDNDGIADNGSCTLGRETGCTISGNDCNAGTGSGLQPVIRYVNAIEFVYFDSNGNVIAVPVVDTSTIKRIQVMIVARSPRPEGGLVVKYTDTKPYNNQQGDEVLPAQNDHFRRFAMSTNITCREL